MGGASKGAKCAPSAEPRAWTGEELVHARQKVSKLQRRIAKAQREKKYDKVKALQHLLVTSRAAKILAVGRVTSNKGKRTAGVDGVTWRTNAAKAQAIGSLFAKRADRSSRQRKAKGGTRCPGSLKTLYRIQCGQSPYMYRLESMRQ